MADKVEDEKQATGVQGAGEEGTRGDEGARNGPPSDGEETFSKDYVEKLRKEAAEHRTRAQRADALHARVLDMAIREATRDLLADPEDIYLSNAEPVEWEDEDGIPDPDKIRAVAEALVKDKPYLTKPKRPAGDVGQGARPDEPADPSSKFAQALREAAG
jgi:hypothetical protein